MTNETTPAFRLRLQLCVWDMLAGIALCIGSGTGFRRPVIWVASLVVLVLALLARNRARERAMASPPLNARQRRILVACYAAPFAIAFFLLASAFAYIHAEPRLWIILLFPALMAFSWILILYNKIHED